MEYWVRDGMSLTGDMPTRQRRDENRGCDWPSLFASAESDDLIGPNEMSAEATERRFGDLICLRRY